MILISHRGNIDGPNKERENSPDYIKEALDLNYDVEIDVWYINKQFYLGHDRPQYSVEPIFLYDNRLWCHAKNLDALLEMKRLGVHFFWHEYDKFTLTSKRYVWSYPSDTDYEKTICVLPELYDFFPKTCTGICSDYISRYK